MFDENKILLILKSVLVLDDGNWKQMNAKKKTVILSYYHFPCNHPVLENVFAKELGRRYDFIFLFQGNVSNGKRQRWHNSEVLLTKSIKGHSFLTAIVNRVLAFNKLYQLLKLFRKSKVKIVMVRDLPFSAFFIAFFRPIWRYKLYYQHSAPLGDINLAYSNFNRGLIRYRYQISGYLYNRFFIKVLKIADLVFSISSFHEEELSKISAKKNMVPLTMGVDTDWLKSHNKKIPYLETIKKTRFLITYFGTLGFTRKPKFILEVFAEVKKRFSNCTLILMGEATTHQEEKELRIECHKLGIQKDVIFTGLLDRKSLKDHLVYCDISISAIPVEDFYIISSPTKIYESLGNGIPVVANKGIYEQEKVIRESGAGLLVDYEIKSFADGIVKLLDNSEIRKKMAEKGRNYVNKNYTYKVIAESIAVHF